MSMGKTQDIVSQIKNKYIGMSVPVKAGILVYSLQFFTAWDKHDNYPNFYENVINR